MAARTHRPSPALLVSLATSAGLLAALSAAVRSRRVPPWERDLFALLNHLPAGLTPVLVLVMQLGSYPAVFVAATAAVLARRIGTAWSLLLAGNLAYWLAVAAKAAVARQRPAALLTDVVLRETITGRYGYPSGHVAVATALALVAARAGGTRWRRAAWAAIALVAGARIHVGAHLPVDVLGGFLVGWLAVCVTRLVVGEVGPQRSVPALRAALRRRGIDVAGLTPIHGDARGSQPWRAVTTGGRQLFVKVTGGEQRDADWAYKLYRRARYRHVADAPPYLSARQQSEHETCMTLLAERGACGSRRSSRPPRCPAGTPSWYRSSSTPPRCTPSSDRSRPPPCATRGTRWVACTGPASHTATCAPRTCSSAGTTSTWWTWASPPTTPRPTSGPVTSSS
ncbi:phosphatase PAP2 family protein [Micromonospora aurantiaca (nom. illeg.)]|uniref:phosphatase PAP2 family protein n=1 Tax=Micromonospora aurantiaca (nom. illeg.) TaxID=47850 RepID=UPI001F0CB2F3|nr:phosphatase PAP2 family protein [Micromonospora aurantiaca]